MISQHSQSHRSATPKQTGAPTNPQTGTTWQVSPQSLGRRPASAKYSGWNTTFTPLRCTALQGETQYCGEFTSRQPARKKIAGLKSRLLAWKQTGAPTNPVPEPHDKSSPSLVRPPKADRCAHQSSDRNHMTRQLPKSRLLTLTCCCRVSRDETQYPHYYVIKYFKVKYNIAESALVCNL